MNALFEYSLLKYVHAISLGEGLNVGILFYFPEEKRLVFRHPVQEKRIKNAFPSVDYPFLKAHLEDFGKTANSLTPSSEVSLEALIQTHFQIWESSPLQFAPCSTSLRSHPDYNIEADLYEDFYFRKNLIKSELKKVEPEFNYFHLTRKSSKDILRYYKSLLDKHQLKGSHLLRRPVAIRNEHSIFIPDAIWQNGTTNAVKAVSFDLNKDQLIIDTTLLLHAKLSYLKDKAEDENIRFDLLVAKPQNEKLLNDYSHALEILHEIKAPKEIIEEPRFDSYSEKTIAESEN